MNLCLHEFNLYTQGYQFWTEADSDGYFAINDIREGEYNLNGYVTGWIGDYQYEQLINITAGYIFFNLQCNQDLYQAVSRSAS